MSTTPSPASHVLVPREVLQPFADLRDQYPESVKIINRSMDGMTPVHITVTKAQLKAMHEALHAAAAPASPPSDEKLREALGKADRALRHVKANLFNDDHVTLMMLQRSFDVVNLDDALKAISAALGDPDHE